MRAVPLLGVAGALLAAFWLAASAGTAAADPVGDFYRGKTIRITVGYGPGGGFDAYAKLLADNLGRHIAGTPTIIVEHMPGAASVKAAGYIYSVAPQDGTALGLVNHAVPLNALLWHEVGDGFDPGKFNWIGRLAPIDVVGVAWHTTGFKSIAEVRQRELVMGATSPTGTSVMTPTALDKLTGTRFRIVQGYQDTTDEYLALERGEIEGMSNAIWSQLKRSHPAWLADGSVVPLYQEAYERAAALPDVPTIIELARDQEDAKVLRLLASTSAVGRSFMTGPRVPPDRVAALRQAFLAMATNPAFLTEAQKLDIPITILSGEAIQRMVAELAGYPEALLERARGIVKQAPR